MTEVYLLLLLLVGLINFVPIFSMRSLDKINESYELNINDNNLAILLRHRALLLGLIGGFIIYSVFDSQYQVVAMILAAISMLGYLFFFWSIGDANPALLKVAKVDIVGVVLLFLAVVIRFFL